MSDLRAGQAPSPRPERVPQQPSYAFSDRIRNDTGTVFASGVQAIARVLVEQLRVDRTNGLRTAAFASGYPGSPLAGLDRELARAAKLVATEFPMVYRPGLNEELAATSVMGSQLAQEHGENRYDGVIGLWFGKAPGLDRACDAIRHATFCGTHRHGGVLCVVGDDPAAKSSTLPSSSDATMVDLHIPILYPVDVQDALDLGRHGIALSRICGLWAGLKVVANVADGTATIRLDPGRVRPVTPEWLVDGKQYVPKPDARFVPPHNLGIEREILEVRLEIARKYGLVNELNRVEVDPGPSARIGITACGYTYGELREALSRLGFPDDASLKAAGIRLMALRMPYPLDPSVLRSFAHDLRELIVVEEKNPTLEWFVKDALWGSAERPEITGKSDREGRPLFGRSGHLDADAILEPLRRRLVAHLGEGRVAPLPPKPRQHIALTDSRTPWFCSGCPHNWGTKVPEGTLYGAGIGCHVMTAIQPAERVGELAGLCAMGGEGMAWLGMEPFVTRTHFIQNLGDGTYSHSGQLAVQAAVAAKAHITFKLLYNGAVAMTGGQDAPGQRSVADTVTILLHQGVSQVLVTTDNVDDYRDVALPTGVQVWDRTRIVEAQERLRDVEGVTVLIHEQPCAAELRRDRKRGLAPTPKSRVLINERVCEGCGHCGETSACLSVQPVETAFGRKTRIDQTTCNLDMSCVQGDCPSFMTVDVDPSARAATMPVMEPPEAVEPVFRVDRSDCTIRMAGIGGTGVVTVSQVLGTAALLEGRHAKGLDQTGLSQKAGPVVSDLRIGTGEAHHSNKAGDATADVLLAFDLLVAADEAISASLHADSIIVGSSSRVATGLRVVHPDRPAVPQADLIDRLSDINGDVPVVCDASNMTTQLLGDASTANIFVLGVAYQTGAIPVGASSIEEAIALNGVAVEKNLAAFRWGRAWVVVPEAVESACVSAVGRTPGSANDPGAPAEFLPAVLDLRVTELGRLTGLGELVRSRTFELIGFQDQRCASDYLDLVEKVAARESAVLHESTFALTQAVARYLYQLTAYKDEYEVARLLTGPEACAAAEAVGGKRAKVTHLLHPPMLRALGMRSKLKFGPKTRPLLGILARGKHLRGTAFDPFGYAHVRKLERELVAEYRVTVSILCDRLTVDNHSRAVEIAELPDQVRGYESRKVQRAGEYRVALAAKLQRL